MSHNVMFGYIHGGSVRSEFMDSVIALLASEERELLGHAHGVTCGPLIAMARNLLVRDFLATDMEFLWMVDTDIVFIPNTLRRLVEHDLPLVSALYYTFKNNGKVPAMFTVGDNHEFPAIMEWDEGELIPADATGAGCLLVHREVFEKIQKDNNGQFCWFRETVFDDRDIGEDLSFSTRVRAAGYPIFVDTSVQVAHVKSALLGLVT